MLKKYPLLCILIPVIISACAGPPKVPPKPTRIVDANQLRSLQVREIEGDLEVCFRSSLFLLQDEGWIVKVADKTNGIIQAESMRKKSSFSPEMDYLRSSYNERPDAGYAIYNGMLIASRGRLWDRWKEANITIESWGKNTTNVRLAVVEKGFLPSEIGSVRNLFGGITQIVQDPERTSSEIVDDPAVYQNFFARLKKEVFVRQNLEKENGKKK